MKWYALSAGLAATLLGGCQPGPSYWIRRQLIEAGLPRADAACMANRLGNNYSSADLRGFDLAALRAIRAASMQGLLAQSEPLLPTESFAILTWAARRCTR